MNAQRSISAAMLYVGAIVFLSSGFVAQFRTTVRKLAGTHVSSPPSVPQENLPNDTSIGGQKFFREQTTTTQPVNGGNVF